MKSHLLLPLIGLAIATPAVAGTLTVKVTNVKSKGGSIHVALYARDPLYREAAASGEAKIVKAGDVDVVIKDAPAGEYVVSAFHDANGDGRLSLEDGKLTEGTAISNAEQLRGPPSFAVNKVAIPATDGNVTIRMSYPEDRQGW